MCFLFFSFFSLFYPGSTGVITSSRVIADIREKST
jgi:hypothetical protein